MVNKRFWLEMLVIVLVFGFLLTGCDIEDITDAGGYTFEFRISYFYNNTPIQQIQFVNGSNRNATVLQTETVGLSSGEPTTYKVSGFTEKDGKKDENNRRICGVIVTFVNGDTMFGWNSAEDKTKFWIQPFSAILDIALASW